MTAVEYLEQINELDKLIKSKVHRVGQLKDEAKRVSVNLDSERVQSSGSKQRMADIVNKYVDIEQGELKNLIEEREGIINTMKELKYLEYDVLFKVYVLGYQLDELAWEYRRSYSWAKKAHSKALKAMKKVLDERQDYEKA